ncbi:MAG: protein kinase [Polyangiaceae bacterium]
MSIPSLPVNVGDTLLGKYQVERIVGAGGMGAVVAVRHIELGELYAMKFMLPAVAENKVSLERFMREARAAAKLTSEHVTKVHDVGRLESGAPYMLMEHLKGQDLEKLLDKQGPVPAKVAARYVMQACDGIAEAHELGIVHRDLKPANLFLTRRANGTDCIKVLDFGISKSVAGADAQSMTRTTSVMGSPYYMSPEQMRSSKNVDFRTDIWSLGVILYQLTTGRVPFPGESITEVCSGVLTSDPPPIIEVLPGIPAELDAIVRRCLEKQAEERYGSARELAAALEALEQSPPAREVKAAPAPAVAVAVPGPRLGPGGTIAIEKSEALSKTTPDEGARSKPAMGESSSGVAPAKTGDVLAATATSAGTPRGTSKAVFFVAGGVIAVALAAGLALRFSGSTAAPSSNNAPVVTATESAVARDTSPSGVATAAPSMSNIVVTTTSPSGSAITSVRSNPTRATATLAQSSAPAVATVSPSASAVESTAYDAAAAKGEFRAATTNAQVSCGGGGAMQWGTVSVTIAPAGTVQSASASGWDATRNACVERAFRKMTVRPFEGSAQSISERIRVAIEPGKEPTPAP